MHGTPVLKLPSSLRPGTFLRCLLFLGNWPLILKCLSALHQVHNQAATNCWRKPDKILRGYLRLAGVPWTIRVPIYTFDFAVRSSTETTVKCVSVRQLGLEAEVLFYRTLQHNKPWYFSREWRYSKVSRTLHEYFRILSISLDECFHQAM